MGYYSRFLHNALRNLPSKTTISHVCTHAYTVQLAIARYLTLYLFFGGYYALQCDRQSGQMCWLW